MIGPKVVLRWGKRPPNCKTPNPLGSNTTLYVHYSDSRGKGIDKRGEPRDAMHNIQNFHMDGRGWCDIAYSYVLFQQQGIFGRPLLFLGRGFGTAPASQEGYNAGNVSVCVVADGSERVKRSTYRALAWLVRRSPAVHVKGHKDVNPTGCPGPYLYSKVGRLDQLAKRPKIAANLP